ncbi:MAG TPA: hypothetical protein VK736_11560, partial [Candidatus Binatia bacterium]|nr:hypothetical protein [Candidatus Binatia bacterium]
MARSEELSVRAGDAHLAATLLLPDEPPSGDGGGGRAAQRLPPRTGRRADQREGRDGGITNGNCHRDSGALAVAHDPGSPQVQVAPPAHGGELIASVVDLGEES